MGRLLTDIMKSAIIRLLFAFVLAVCSVSATTLRDPSDHARNFLLFGIGFGIGLFVILIGVIIWAKVEGFELCKKKKRRRRNGKQRKPPTIDIPDQKKENEKENKPQETKERVMPTSNEKDVAMGSEGHLSQQKGHFAVNCYFYSLCPLCLAFD